MIGSGKFSCLCKSSDELNPQPDHLGLGVKVKRTYIMTTCRIGTVNLSSRNGAIPCSSEI